MEMPQLHRAFLELTGDCNYTQEPCVYCRNFEQDSEGKGKFILNDRTILPNKEIKKRIKDVKELGANEVILTGGEPLLREDIVDIIKYSSESGLQTLVATNGRKLTLDFLDQIKQYKNLIIQVSIDSVVERINDELRGEGSYRTALQAINYSRQYKVPLQISTTITSKNLFGIQELVGYFPLENIKLRRLVGEGLAKSRQDLIVEEEELTKILQQFVLNPEYKDRIAAEQIPYVVDCDGHPRVYSCSAGNSILYIKANGDITPCPSVSTVVSNLSQATLEDIWINGFSKFRADKYRLSGHCGRKGLLLLGKTNAHFDYQQHIPFIPLTYEQFQSSGCKCTG